MIEGPGVTISDSASLESCVLDDRRAADVALKEKLLDTGSVVRLYGTTPPRAGTAGDAIQAVGEKLAARLRDLAVDGVVVYDIQDESGRTQLARPFAFTGTVDPRSYSHLLVARTGKPTITYKCVGDLDESGWLAWLTETAGEFGAGCLSIVGRPPGCVIPLRFPRRSASPPRTQQDSLSAGS